MAELSVDMVYGSALLEAARETEKEKEILADAKSVLTAMDDNPDFKKFVDYPGISASEKKEILENIFAGKISKEFMNFLFVLVDKRRAGRLVQIIKVYEHLIEKQEGVSYGTVYSVVPITQEKLEEIEEQTEKLLQTRVHLDNQLQPNLMAGFRILIDGKVIDASYKKKFEEMAARLKIKRGM
ncbi:MAG: ATP synthase F1 subunit delta [Eubacteriales bacterium]|nr:ATP synthase F1 subunit delta [Eubacteriales bacterium]